MTSSQVPTIESLSYQIELLTKLINSTIPQIKPATVSEVLKNVRRDLMNREKSRLNARTKNDGSINERDTSTYRAYNTHLKLLEKTFGSREIHTLTLEEIRNLHEIARLNAIKRSKELVSKKALLGIERKPSNGNRAFNMCKDAYSLVWKTAKSQGAVNENIIQQIERARISDNKRYALKISQLEDLYKIIQKHHVDPFLDYAIVWTISETACRRAGVLNLRVGDINIERQTIVLREKNDSKDEQPISKPLMECLLQLAGDRGAKLSSDLVFQKPLKTKKSGYINIDGKYIDTLFSKLRNAVKWSAKTDFSAHWLRHTTLTLVERRFGSAVAQRYARHKTSTITDTYTEASLIEVAQALVALTGIDHPLAHVAE